jgi:hypothetical protein
MLSRSAARKMRMNKIHEMMVKKLFYLSILYTRYNLTKIYEIMLLENFIRFTVKLATNFMNIIPVSFKKKIVTKR